MNLNGITVAGNLTGKPTKGNMPNVTVANFRVAIDKRGKNPKGEEYQRTDYVDVEAFGDLADNCIASLDKGNRVIIAGALCFDEWTDKDGAARSRHKIRAQVVGRSLEYGT